MPLNPPQPLSFNNSTAHFLLHFTQKSEREKGSTILQFVAQLFLLETNNNNASNKNEKERITAQHPVLISHFDIDFFFLLGCYHNTIT
jgi:hypothetical protein